MMSDDPVEMPRLIEGGLGMDDRGSVSFVNGFDFGDVRRFFVVSNHRQGFVRAWHAHRNEAKYASVLSGAAVVGAVRIDNWDAPSQSAEVQRFVLSATKPAVLFIPRGYANGFMSLTDDTKIAFFSTATVEESRGDDVRYDARHWDIWSVAER